MTERLVVCAAGVKRAGHLYLTHGSAARCSMDLCDDTREVLREPRGPGRIDVHIVSRISAALCHPLGIWGGQLKVEQDTVVMAVMAS